MKTFEAPKAVINEFNVEDILTTSGEASGCSENVDGPCLDD